MWRSKTRASEHIRVFRVFRGQKKRERDLSDLSVFFVFQRSNNIKQPHILTVMRLSKLKQPIKEIDCLLYLLVKRPLSVLRTPFDFPLRTVDLFDIPHKGQEAAAVWTFSLGLSALAFPAPSRGRVPARQEGVFTKRLSDKQYIMKAASLLEHKCFFQVFVFTGQQYFLLL